MKEVGRFNVTREQLDAIFAEGHDGISISTMVGSKIQIAGFAIYENDDNTRSIKIIDTAGRDYYTTSQVFVKNLILFLQSKDDDEFPVEITVSQATSKKGRTYLTIEEAIGSDGDNNNWRSIKF